MVEGQLDAVKAEIARLRCQVAEAAGAGKVKFARTEGQQGGPDLFRGGGGGAECQGGCGTVTSGGVVQGVWVGGGLCGDISGDAGAVQGEAWLGLAWMGDREGEQIWTDEDAEADMRGMAAARGP